MSLSEVSLNNTKLTLLLGMGEVVPACTSPTVHPPSPSTSTLGGDKSEYMNPYIPTQIPEED